MATLFNLNNALYSSALHKLHFPIRTIFVRMEISVGNNETVTYVVVGCSLCVQFKGVHCSGTAATCHSSYNNKKKNEMFSSNMLDETFFRCYCCGATVMMMS